jgi:hypothetical protein
MIILNKQSKTHDKKWSSSFAIGHGANNSSPQKMIKMDLREIGQGGME